MESRTIEAIYHVTTPLFCAGVDRAGAELRPGSFKGLLRFWWRALAWSRMGGDLAAIRKKEETLFGSSRTGQSKVRLRLTPQQQPTCLNKGRQLKVRGTHAAVVGPGVRYLGYGVMEAVANRGKGTKEGQLTRDCLLPPLSFKVELTCRRPEADDLASVTDALKALGLLGGMGAKSRKGFGSLVLRSLSGSDGPNWQAPESVDQLATEIHRLYGAVGSASGDAWPEYTALSARSRHVLLTGHSGSPDALELLDRVGCELIRYRSWGHRGMILGREPSERNFKDDHDLMKGLPVDIVHPRRIAFGLPHNYGKGLQVGPAGRGLDRRASPLLIHMHTCGKRPVAVLSFLPARFLPKGRDRISVGGRTVELAPPETLYQPVARFLDRLCDPKQRREPFAQALEVRP